nr:MAG TPA: hypothetical protein [Caudoviricetes sp.]
MSNKKPAKISVLMAGYLIDRHGLRSSLFLNQL